MIKNCKTIIVILLLSLKLHAQDRISFGISGMYNFPLETIGIGLRSQIPLNERFSIVPQIKYAPSFNTIHEFYGGVNAHFFLLNNTIAHGYRGRIEPKKPVLYLAAGVEYNRWINYEKTKNTKANQNNFLPEVGLGVSLGGHLVRAFAEIKYNVLWEESYGEFGVMIYPFNDRKNRKNNCPKVY
jgi:hypothetical protein